MNQKELIDQLNAITGESKASIERVLKAHADLIAGELQTSGQASLHYGIGILKTADTAAREGRNPSTGATIQIAAGKRIKFSASKALKEAVKA